MRSVELNLNDPVPIPVAGGDAGVVGAVARAAPPAAGAGGAAARPASAARARQRLDIQRAFRRHGDINKPSKDPHGRVQAIKKWENLKDLLNSDPTGEVKCVDEVEKKKFNVLGKLKKEYGRAFRFWLGPDLNYCISDPDDVKILLHSNKTSARGPQYKYMVDVLGYGILSGSGPVWRKRRKLISPNYGKKATESYSYSCVFNEETNILVERLRARPIAEPFNVYEEVVKTTTYTVCQTLFGLTREQTLNLPHLNDIVQETHQMYAEAFLRMTTWYLQIEPYYRISQYYRRSKKFMQKTMHMADTIVKHRVEKMYEISLSERDDHHNTVENNLSLSTVDKIIMTKSVPNSNVLKQIFTIFTTSQETSANIASFLLLMMAYHPDCQEKLYLEIKSVLTDDEVSDAAIKRMPYLDMVFKEVIRLFPIGSMVQRTIVEDIDIGCGTLPAGSSLLVPIFHIHRDEDFWENPDAFDPERFSPERSAARNPYCYIPFSLGSMDCLGRHFGTKLVKTIGIKVLREFRLSSPETYADLKLLCAVSVESVNGYPVLLHPRVISRSRTHSTS